MVRIRKNANTLSTAERNRVVSAFAQLNNQGLGRFVDFRDMHVLAADLEEHTRPGFLAWHRAYVLDLERELQAIDPSVALPYWRFDRAAPNIFKRDFLGESDNNGTVSFSSTNPLQFWKTDNMVGISRTPLFNTNSAPPNPMSEAAHSCPRHSIYRLPKDGGQPARTRPYEFRRFHRLQANGRA